MILRIKLNYKQLLTVQQGKDLAAKDRSGTSDPVSSPQTTSSQNPSQMLTIVFSVHHCFFRRISNRNQRCSQDTQPRMECFRRNPSYFHPKPCSRCYLLGQGSIRKRLHG